MFGVGIYLGLKAFIEIMNKWKKRKLRIEKEIKQKIMPE